MKRDIKLIMVAAAMLLPSLSAIAGNNDRAGQAGANELLINPWARSSGWMGCNIANVTGTEAQYLNVAGTAFTKKTDIGFTHTTLFKGSGVNINTAAISVKSGESSALTLGITAFDLGDNLITTADQPEGGLGKFSPQFINLALSYAKGFSKSIYGGMTVRIISEGIDDANAQGMAFDAGIQYVSGFNEAKDNLKFGIALRNVGAPLKYKGEGFSFKAGTDNGNIITIQPKTERFEMPSLIQIGASYDWKIAEMHRITFASSFVSNSFTRDQVTAGLEYGFKKLFMLRAGYTFQGTDEHFNDEISNAFTGLGAGVTFELPIGKSGKALGLDYSYRDTDPFDGTHSFGLMFRL
jgi:hypothetical protein